MTKQDLNKELQIELKIEKAISKYSQRYLSNSKWLKLINLFVCNIDIVKKVQVKKVHCDEIGELYIDENTRLNFDYYDIGFEGKNSFGGWLTFKEIEYLVFPREIESIKNKTQDLEQIRNLINSIGQFSLELEFDELKLKCYEK